METMLLNNNCLQKRVACLYRVSTKGQIDKNDIPLQRRACREFIIKNNWKLVREYYEKGVSGYRTSANERYELQKIKYDVETKLFDILLVFTFDRLGRIENETPVIVEWLSSQGIDIWSVTEGEQKLNGTADKLSNYLRYWQSSEESRKIALRVNEKHKQMVKDGIFRGGNPPYGYRLKKNGETNKNGKELFDLEIDPGESKIIKKIYELVFHDNYGGNRIVKFLNENSIPTKTGGKWGCSVVNYILRNPIYKGYMVYNKTIRKLTGHTAKTSSEDWIISEEKRQDLEIVDEEIWNAVQSIRTNRTPKKNCTTDSIDNYNLEGSTSCKGPTKSPLLLIGLIKCGHCNSPLTTTYHYKEWKNKDGAVRKKLRVKYRCSGKSLSRVKCEGQTVYSQEKIETIVLKSVYNSLSAFRQLNLSEKANEFKHTYIDNTINEIKLLQIKLEELYDELFINTSKFCDQFNTKMLHNLLLKKEEEIDSFNSVISYHYDKLKEEQTLYEDLKRLQEHLPTWEETFKSSDLYQRKLMISCIIENVTVYKDILYIDNKVNRICSISPVRESYKF